MGVRWTEYGASDLILNCQRASHALRHRIVPHASSTCRGLLRSIGLVSLGALLEGVCVDEAHSDKLGPKVRPSII